MESSNLQRGIQLFELSRYEEAIKYLTEDIESWTARYYLALCYYNLGSYTKSQDLADNILSENPDNEGVFFLKAQIAIAQDKKKEALSFINQAIEINPYDADAFALKAGIYLRLKKYDVGLEMVNEALQLKPTNSYALNIRAQLLTKLERIEDASKTVEDILLENPEDSYSHANVGWIALENNDTQKALVHFKEALQHNPNLEYAREGMSTALKSKNFIYSYYLKYSFWISKKSSGGQWGFIIGIYLVYRFSFKFLTEQGLTFLAIPLVIAYLLFALGSWMMESMSNMILNFDSYGKHLLDKNEKISGYLFGALSLLGILSITIFYTLDLAYFLPLAVAAAAALIPLPRAFLLQTKKARVAGFLTGAIILSIGFLGLLFYPDAVTVSIAAFFTMVVYTWVSNIFGD